MLPMITYQLHGRWHRPLSQFHCISGLEIEKNMACQAKSLSQVKNHIACYFIFVPAKNGEVSYVVEKNVLM